MENWETAGEVESSHADRCHYHMSVEDVREAASPSADTCPNGRFIAMSNSFILWMPVHSQTSCNYGERSGMIIKQLVGTKPRLVLQSLSRSFQCRREPYRVHHGRMASLSFFAVYAPSGSLHARKIQTVRLQHGPCMSEYSNIATGLDWRGLLTNEQ